MEHQERDFKGVWIPKELYFRTDLSWSEKFLLIEIDSLDKGDGCWASNEHLADFLGLTEGGLKNLLTALRKRNFLIDRGFDGRVRRLSINLKLTKKSMVRSPKSDRVGHQNMTEGNQNMTEKPQKIPNGGFTEPQKVDEATLSNTIRFPIVDSDSQNSRIARTSLEGEEIPSFEEFLNEQGITSDYEGGDSETVAHLIYRDASGKKVSEASVKKTYTYKYRPRGYKPASKEFDDRTESFINLTTKLLMARHSTSPVVTQKTKQIISQHLVLVYPIPFIQKYATWFMDNEQIPLKFKFNFSSMASTSFINQFIAETGISPN
jgi:hypothetical protein